MKFPGAGQSSPDLEFRMKLLISALMNAKGTLDLISVKDTVFEMTVMTAMAREMAAPQVKAVTPVMELAVQAGEAWLKLEALVDRIIEMSNKQQLGKAPQS